jgi:signal transduction histidine kinase
MARWTKLDAFWATGLDVAIALSVAVFAAANPGRWEWGTPAAWVTALALVWRRRYPIAVAVAGSAVAAVQLALDPTYGHVSDMGLAVAWYSAVMHARTMRTVLIAGGAVLSIWIAVIGAASLEAPGFRDGTDIGSVEDDSAFVAIGVAVICVAYARRLRRQRLAEQLAALEERAATAERERDHLARLAAAEERASIARELHDVVAHNLAVMIVQADAPASRSSRIRRGPAKRCGRLVSRAATRSAICTASSGCCAATAGRPTRTTCAG